MTTLITDKTTSVVNHLFDDIMLKGFFSRILHSDNGTEFKSILMENLSQQLGIKKTFVFPCYQQVNGRLESSQRLIKDCVRRFSINGVLERDQLLPYTPAAFK